MNVIPLWKKIIHSTFPKFTSLLSKLFNVAIGTTYHEPFGVLFLRIPLKKINNESLNVDQLVKYISRTWMFVQISSLTISDKIVSYWDLHMHIFSKAPQNDLMHGNKGRCWLLILLWSSSRRIVMADLWNTYKKNLLVSPLVYVYNKHPAYRYQKQHRDTSRGRVVGRERKKIWSEIFDQ